MKKIVVYILTLITAFSCSPEQIPDDTDLAPIRLSVVADGVVSRAYMYDDDLTKEQEFGLNAYLIDGNNTLYLENAWVYYFNGWHFRDQNYQGKLLDYYWPNDHNVNFVAYMPYNMNKSVVDINDLGFTNERGFTFNCDLATSDNDRIIDDTKDNTRTIKHEFVYAYRHNAQKGDIVKLRFVHPFAAVKFQLSQSHRDLTIHSITLSGLNNAGTYTNAADTYDNYKTGQNTLTYDTWTSRNSGTMKIDYEKSVPEDINYYSLIGGPYLVIPQALTNVKLSVNYSWDIISEKNTNPISIVTSEIPAWQPGMVYTYTLNLGDNKEEILFKATVEPWTKGEDEGYENQYNVK